MWGLAGLMPRGASQLHRTYLVCSFIACSLIHNSHARVPAKGEASAHDTAVASASVAARGTSASNKASHRHIVGLDRHLYSNRVWSVVLLLPRRRRRDGAGRLVPSSDFSVDVVVIGM